MAKRPAYSKLCKALADGHFVFTGELEPKKILADGMEEVIHSAKEMKKTNRIIAANVTDGPQGDAYMCSLVPSFVVQRDAEIEAVWQVAVRDRNRVALFGDVLGGALLGLKNILVLTGDHTALGDNKQGGNEITDGKIKMNYGCVANPNAVGEYMEPEILKVGRKVEQGIDFIQTQTAFDIEVAKNFINELARYNVPILLGVFPMKSYGIAWYFDKYIPGVSVPKDLLNALKKAEKDNKGNKPAKYAALDKVNVEFFVPFIEEIKKNSKASGIHCMAVEYERLFAPLLDKYPDYAKNYY